MVVANELNSGKSKLTIRDLSSRRNHRCVSLMDDCERSSSSADISGSTTVLTECGTIADICERAERFYDD